LGREVQKSAEMCLQLSPCRRFHFCMKNSLQSGVMGCYRDLVGK
jgi:hypothetical protein